MRGVYSGLETGSGGRTGARTVMERGEESVRCERSCVRGWEGGQLDRVLAYRGSWKLVFVSFLRSQNLTSMRRVALRLRSQAQRPSTARWAARSASSLSSRPAPSSSARASPLSASRIAVVGAACVGVATGGGATFTTHASSAPHGASAPASYLRVMLPDDANPAGNVHGGTILKMIEMAGYIAATRHANKLNGSEKQAPPLPPAHAHIARIDHMDFLEVRPAVCLAPERGWGGMAGWASLPRARATEIAFCPTATANPLWIGTNTCSPSSNALSLNIYALSVNLLTHSSFLPTLSPSQPMFIGEVARLDAEVQYASPHSIEVLG